MWIENGHKAIPRHRERASNEKQEPQTGSVDTVFALDYEEMCGRLAPTLPARGTWPSKDRNNSERCPVYS